MIEYVWGLIHKIYVKLNQCIATEVSQEVRNFKEWDLKSNIFGSESKRKKLHRMIFKIKCIWKQTCAWLHSKIHKFQWFIFLLIFDINANTEWSCTFQSNKWKLNNVERRLRIMSFSYILVTSLSPFRWINGTASSYGGWLC